MIAVSIESIFYLLSVATKLKLYKLAIRKMLKGTYLAFRKMVPDLFLSLINKWTLYWDVLSTSGSGKTDTTEKDLVLNGEIWYAKQTHFK